MLGRRRPVRSRGTLSGHRRVAHCDLSALRNEIVLEGKSETVVTEISPFAESQGGDSVPPHQLLASRPRTGSGEGRVSKNGSTRSLPATRRSRGSLPPFDVRSSSTPSSGAPTAGSFLKPTATSRRTSLTDGSSAMKGSSPSNLGRSSAAKDRLGAAGRVRLPNAPTSGGSGGGSDSFLPKATRSVLPKARPRGRGLVQESKKSPSAGPAEVPQAGGRKKLRETEILFGNIDLHSTDTDPFEH